MDIASGFYCGYSFCCGYKCCDRDGFCGGLLDMCVSMRGLELKRHWTNDPAAPLNFA